MQTYLTLAEFKGEGVANLTSDLYNTRLLPHLEAVSRQVEAYLGGRWFYPRIETRYFSGSDGAVQKFPGLDIISVTTLKEDENNDATYETTWASTDYILAPYDADPNNVAYPKPHWQLEVDDRSTGTKSSFGKGQKRFELTGKFGYCELTEATGTTINEGAAFSDSDTELTVADGSKLAIGMTLKIDSEYLYVTGQDVSSGNDFTVVRGVNGSTAAAHSDGTAISKLVYPAPLVQACIMQASRLWARRIGNYSAELGFAEVGNMSPHVGFDLDVRQLLDKFKRYTIA